MESSSSHRVLIIGGGLAGLALGNALHSLNIPFSIFEQYDNFNPVGAGVVLTPNGINALDEISSSVSQKIRDIYNKNNYSSSKFPFLTPRGINFYVTKVNLIRKYGAPYMGLYRSTVHSLMRETLPPDSLHVGYKLAKIEQDDRTVTAYFENGCKETGTLLFGCDGIKSTVRHLIFDERPPLYYGVTSVRGMVELKDFEFKDGFYGTDTEFCYYAVPILEKPSWYYWCTTKIVPKGEWPKRNKQEVYQELIDNCRVDPVRRMTQATELKNIVLTDLHLQHKLPHWTKGRVCLIGDSVHPVSPFIGQGVNGGFEGVLALLRAFKKNSSIEEMWKFYEKIRINRANKVMDMSEKMTLSSHSAALSDRWEKKHFILMRNLLILPITRFFASQKRLNWIYGYKIPNI